jgi:hypothetical protein
MPQHTENNPIAKTAEILIPSNEVMLSNIAHRATEYPKETMSEDGKSSFCRKGEKESNKKPGPKNNINPAASRTHERKGICSSVIRI